MDITKMLTFARNYPLRPLVPSKTFSEKEQLAGQYVLVIYYLGQLMGSIQANQAAFVHAWHIFLKFGLVDLGFTAGEIEAQYLQA